MAKETQVSAFISGSVKDELEKLVRARGLKKGFVIQRALEHHLQALRELPAEFIIPPTLVVTKEAMGRILHRLRTRPKPTKELRKLMKGEPVSENGLH